MARNFAPPSGFVLDDTPPATAPAPEAAPMETATLPGATVPEGFVMDPESVRGPGDAPAPLEVEVQGGKPPEVGMLESFGRGVLDLALLGGADEAMAGARSLVHGTTYDDELKKYRERSDAAWDQNPWSYGIGGALGVVPTLALPGGAIANAGRGVARVGAAAGVGAGYGALGGALGADEDRLTGAAVGATLGGVGGAALPPLIAAGGNLASRVSQAFPGRNAMGSLDRLFTRAPQEAGRLSDAVAERRALGFEPTLADIVDEQGAGTLRAAAQRGEARDTAVSYARERRVNLQDRVAEQAAPISPESRPTQQVVDEIRDRRTRQANADYDAIRATPIEVDDDIRRVLDTGAGRRALRNAIETSDDPAEVAGFLRGLQRSNEPSELDRMMEMLPEGMNATAREQVRRQLIDQGVDAGEPLPQFTLDMLDRVKRDLQARMRQPDASGQSRQYQRMVDALVSAGDNAAPGYAQARGNFAAESGLMEAADVGTGILGTGRNVDNFIDEATRLSNTRRPLADGAELPSERDIARTAARRTIENTANQGPRAALGLADQMAYGRNALNRLSALTDPATAERVRAGMAVAATDARRTNFLDPNAGSKTSSMLGDMGADLVEGGINMATGNKIGLLRQAMRWVNNSGIRQVDADRLWQLATDPARTDEAIDYLVRRGARQIEASRIVRSLSARPVAAEAGTTVDY